MTDVLIDRGGSQQLARLKKTERAFNFKNLYHSSGTSETIQVLTAEDMHICWHGCYTIVLASKE